jgi:hypothetical protein
MFMMPCSSFSYSNTRGVTATLVAEAMAIVRAAEEAVVTCGHEVSHGTRITESEEIPTEVGVVVFLGTRRSGG